MSETPDKLTILTSVDGEARDLSTADRRFLEHRASESILNAELRRQFPALALGEAMQWYEDMRNAYRQSDYDDVLALAARIRAAAGWYAPAEWLCILAAEGKNATGIDALWQSLADILDEWRGGKLPPNGAELEHDASDDNLRWLLSSVRFNQGERAREQGRLADAAQHLRAARALGQGLSDQAREAKLRINEAYVLVKLGDTEQASIVLAPVLSMDTELVAEILARKSVELTDLPTTLDSIR